MKFAAAAGIVLALGASEARAEPLPPPGLYLCRSPAFAGDFWGALARAQQLGVQVDRKIAIGIAEKNGCVLVLSTKFRAQNYVGGEMLVSDGTHAGWVSPELYILYEKRLDDPRGP